MPSYPIPSTDAQGHACFATIFTIGQIFYLDGFSNTVQTRLSKPVSLLLGLLLLGALVGALLAVVVGGGTPKAWLSLLYFLSYEKLFISTVKVRVVASIASIKSEALGKQARGLGPFADIGVHFTNFLPYPGRPASVPQLRKIQHGRLEHSQHPVRLHGRPALAVAAFARLLGHKRLERYPGRPGEVWARPRFDAI